MAENDVENKETVRSAASNLEDNMCDDRNDTGHGNGNGKLEKKRKFTSTTTKVVVDLLTTRQRPRPKKTSKSKAEKGIDEKPYKCLHPGCNKRFAVASYLRQHMVCHR